MAVDQLAEEYKDQPVAFLEYDVDAPDSERVMYFWSAHAGGSVLLPLIVVDSGNQITSGYEDFYTVYKQMVDTALARPPQVDITANWWREGDRIVTKIKLTNQSDVTLGLTNEAKVHAIVYENSKVQLTHRYVRAQVSQRIGDAPGHPSADLEPGDTAIYTLTSEDLTDVDWGKLEVVTIADYRPGQNRGPFDALQGAKAAKEAGAFTLSTSRITFLIDSTSERPGASRRETVHIGGTAGMTWTAAPDAPWLTVTPSTGTTNADVEVALLPALMGDGWQQGVVTFSVVGQEDKPLTVDGYRGELSFLYLPVSTK